MDEQMLSKLRDAVDRNWSAQIEWLKTLVNFPSKRGAEGPCQDWLAQQYRERGWSVDRYSLAEVEIEGLPGYSPAVDVDYSKAIQVVASVRSEVQRGRSLILQGHIDVVPEGPRQMWTRAPFQSVVEGDRLYGRGSDDMKAGVSCLVFALDALRTAGFAPASDIFVQTVSEEESTGNGALSTLARGYRADAALIPEPSANTITRAQVGAIWFRLRVRGTPAHVAYSETGTNAVLSAMHLVRAFEVLTVEINRRAETHPHFKSVRNPIKFNPGKISGGDWTSSTPAWCDVDCRIGLLPGVSLEEAKAEILATVASASETDDYLRANPPEVIWHGFQADPYVLEPGTQAEAVLAAAHKSVLGQEMNERASTAVNDARFYGRYYGIPGLCYGPTGARLHGFDEYCDLPSVKNTTLIIAAFIADWCKVRPIG